MEYYDTLSRHLIVDTEIDPFQTGIPRFTEVQEAAEAMILSASGWRKIFAADANEESTARGISPADTIIAGTAAQVLSGYFKELAGGRKPVLYTGCDARPTGPAILDIMHRIFLASGVEIRSVFIAAAPEIMACVKLDEEADGFVYISASHNPIGHNGLKFGGADGAVFGGNDSDELIRRFREALSAQDITARISETASRTSEADYAALLGQIPKFKQLAMQRYAAFTTRVAAGTADSGEQKQFFSMLKKALGHTPIGIVGELNGSARGTSIDRDFLGKCGFLTEMHNDTPGAVVHRIVPEGRSLDLCADLLQQAHTKDRAFAFGYVPDNDGDRGNIVYIDPEEGQTHIIQAQEVFALAVLAELAYQQASPADIADAAGPPQKAVVVNGPTSMRIERIAEVFSARVFRAEVGEANVVRLADSLRGQGFDVRILGEGSNGGNITYPATVRDPLNTLFSLAKLTAFRSADVPLNLFADWCGKSGNQSCYRSGFSLHDVLSSLPPFVTTSAYEPEAIMKIRTTDHRLLKARYEKLFLEEWQSRRDFLRQEFGIRSWREVNYEGTQMKEGFGPDFRSGREKGGLKIIFSDRLGRDTDFIWMRGSGTEPVFRVLVDSEGSDRKRHDWLLDWHRGMIDRADKFENT